MKQIIIEAERLFPDIGDVKPDRINNRRLRHEYILKNILPYTKGDILEIGACIGESTIIYLKIAQKHKRIVHVFDPWMNEQWFDTFIETTKDYKDNCIVYRQSSTIQDSINKMLAIPKIAFAFVDGAHDYYSARSDIQVVAKCSPTIICVDDVTHDQVERALSEMINQIDYEIVQLPKGMQEVYLVKTKTEAPDHNSEWTNI